MLLHFFDEVNEGGSAAALEEDGTLIMSEKELIVVYRELLQVLQHGFCLQSVLPLSIHFISGGDPFS